MKAIDKQELITEIKVNQAILEELTYLQKYYSLPFLLERIKIKNDKLRELREAYFSE